MRTHLRDDGTGLSDRGYRDAQLLAGLVMGRLHILAPTVGAGANGMTFGDLLVPALLGDGATADLLCLLWTCLGVPEYHPSPAANRRRRRRSPSCSHAWTTGPTTNWQQRTPISA